MQTLIRTPLQVWGAAVSTASMKGKQMLKKYKTEKLTIKRTGVNTHIHDRSHIKW